MIRFHKLPTAFATYILLSSVILFISGCQKPVSVQRFKVDTTLTISTSNAKAFMQQGSYAPLLFSGLKTKAKIPGFDQHSDVPFGFSMYGVPAHGPTADRANQAVCIGWNPMTYIPDQPGYWWQYESGYKGKWGGMFELNLDVRDSTEWGNIFRRVSYKMKRLSGNGISADYAFDNITFTDGSHNAGSTYNTPDASVEWRMESRDAVYRFDSVVYKDPVKITYEKGATVYHAQTEINVQPSNKDVRIDLAKSAFTRINCGKEVPDITISVTGTRKDYAMQNVVHVTNKHKTEFRITLAGNIKTPDGKDINNIPQNATVAITFTTLYGQTTAEWSILY